MKKSVLLALAIVVVSLSAFTYAVIWKADSANSTVNFELPGSDKKGTFSGLDATIDFDKKKLDKSKITASIDVKTVKTGIEKLDAHLLSPDFFEAEKFPKITFTSTSIAKSDSGYIAKGNLTMKDSTKAIELPFTYKEEGKNKGTLSGIMTINACDYGVMKANKAGKDKVVIRLVVPVTK